MDKPSRSSFILHLSSFIFLFLSACAPVVETATSPTSTPEADAGPSPTADPVSSLGVEADALDGVTVTVWHPWFGPEASLLETQAAEFNTTNEWGITVLTAGQGNYTELFNNVTAALVGVEQPDLVIALPEHALFWREQDGVVDLTPYVNDPLWGLAESESISPALWAQDKVNGVILGAPAQRSARFLFYNQTWARELGFDAPPAAPDKFREQACAANQSFRKNEEPSDDGFGGWYVDTQTMTALSWMLAFGDGPLQESGFRFLKPDNLEAMRFVKTLAEDGCAWQSAEADPFDEFAARRALFATGSLEDLPAQSRAFTALGSDDEWTVIPFPDETLVIYGSSFVLIPSTDEEQLAAWIFVRWMLSDANQARWVKSTGLFPLRPSTFDLAADYEATHPQWAEAVKLIPLGQTYPQLTEWRTVKLILGDGFNFMFRVGTPSGQVPVILRQMDEAVADLRE
ncbi:MAG: extracellular solute-binding protein [Chloroflexota bacterium]